MDQKYKEEILKVIIEGNREIITGVYKTSEDCEKRVSEGAARRFKELKEQEKNKKRDSVKLEIYNKELGKRRAKAKEDVWKNRQKSINYMQLTSKNIPMAQFLK